MKKSFFIAGLLATLVSITWSQKKYSNNIIINQEMPEAWGRAVTAVITLTNANKMEVKKISANINTNKPLSVDIRSLKSGVYTLKVKPATMKESSAEFTTDVTKKKGDNNIVLTFSACSDPSSHRAYVKKPVIYLYPEQEEDITVRVSFKGELTETIPTYNGGWKVSATPNGSITNYADGMQYPYLFWEGSTNKQDWNMKEGFVVSKGNSRAFLEDQLQAMGLAAKEYNEFIDFWVPLLQKNEYNLIHFAGSEYEDIAALSIDPKPDAMLRVFMVFKAADKNTQVIMPQHYKWFVRKGFTVVEWGGMELGVTKQEKAKS